MPDQEMIEQAREVLAATLGLPVKSNDTIDLSDRDQVWTDQAIEAMLTFRNAALDEAAGALHEQLPVTVVDQAAAIVLSLKTIEG